MKPEVRHAGCGGEIGNSKLPEAKYDFLRCQRCGCQITDPMQLAPRGTGYKKEQDASAQWDAVSLGTRPWQQ